MRLLNSRSCFKELSELKTSYEAAVRFDHDGPADLGL